MEYPHLTHKGKKIAEARRLGFDPRSGELPSPWEAVKDGCDRTGCLMTPLQLKGTGACAQSHPRAFGSEPAKQFGGWKGLAGGFAWTCCSVRSGPGPADGARLGVGLLQCLLLTPVSPSGQHPIQN